jgi:serine/threonine protein kinase
MSSAASEPCPPIPPELLEEVFTAASELSGDEREAYLSQRCSVTPGLRRAVEDLLRAGEATLLDGAAIEMEARQLASAGAFAAERLGPYRILSRLGAGGMGTVYLAERDDDGLRKTVAIKIVHCAFPDDAGTHADAVRRFQQERQLLAGLEHPHIARMLDAGRTPDGLPYLVMEYVDGIPIDRYAAERNLDVAAKLELIRGVCGAVSCAHANLIVHRDLKPRNILVTADGCPKLLDFGIAKMLSETSEAGASTGVMTPGYASPEQIAGRPITTATDVYSLAVILWELLSGRKLGRAPLSSAGAGADLDTIVRKGLHEDPARRYASVAEFSDDVARYLGGFPVKARPDTFSYRAGKFVKRRRVEVAAALAVVLILAAAAAVTLAQYRAASRRFNETRALVNSLLFELNDAVSDLPGSSPARLLLARRAQQYLDILAGARSSDPGVRRDLATAYRRVGDILGQPYHANLGDMAGALANYRKAAAVLEERTAFGGEDPVALTELAQVYGLESAILSRQVQTGEAVRLSEKAVPLLERIAAHEPRSREARLEVANAYLMVSLARVVECWERQAPESCHVADDAAAKAEPMALQLVAELPDNDLFRYAASRAFHFRAYAEIHMGAFEANPAWLALSLRHHQQGFEQDEAAFRLKPGRYRNALADAWGDLGQAYLNVGQFRKAEAAARESLSRFQEIAASDPENAEARRNVAVSYARIAGALVQEHRDSEAGDLQEQALSMYESLLRREPKNRDDLEPAVSIHNDLARYQATAGDGAAALGHYRRNLELLDAFPDSPDSVWLALNYGLLADGLARWDRAQAAVCYQKAAALWARLRDSGHLPAAYAGKPAALEQAAIAASR